jgi:hypothetical protein
MLVPVNDSHTSDALVLVPVNDPHTSDVCQHSSDGVLQVPYIRTVRYVVTTGINNIQQRLCIGIHTSMYFRCFFVLRYFNV